MDGVLVVDKPQGPTSHDVVAAARRLLGERRIGHTGTLDPLATGVLPLAIARATRLVRFLAASDKEYDATILFGVTTDSYDITGEETSRSGSTPSREAVERAIGALTGEYRQTPPAFSAKKVGGRRAYALARDDRDVAVADAPVRVDRAELLAFDEGRARVTLTCSAGFYVRSFARDLGARVGTGACLEALRRTRAGEFTLETAVRLDELAETGRLLERVVPLGGVLRTWPAVTLTDRGRDRVAHGQRVDTGDYTAARPQAGVPNAHACALGWENPSSGPWVRLLDGRGALVAMATPGPPDGSLHPSVVLI